MRRARTLGLTPPSWFSRDPEQLQFLREERKQIHNHQCPACGSTTGGPYLRAIDQMYVCSRCASYAYIDYATGAYLYAPA